MIKNSWLLFILFFGSCLRDEKKENKQLDTVMLDLQRMAMWHREYYFQVIRWKGKNQDSADLYEIKMDSALIEYQKYLRAYDSLIKIFKSSKQ